MAERTLAAAAAGGAGTGVLPPTKLGGDDADEHPGAADLDDADEEARAQLVGGGARGDLPLRPFRETVPFVSWRARAAALARAALPDRSSLTVLPWVRGYTLTTALRDLTAAAVVATVLVPQSMSYALLAGVDPVYGLYSSITPLFVYGLVTTSSSIAGGPVGPTAILMAGMVAGVTGAPERSPAFTLAALQLTFACGVVLAVMVLLRLGWVSDLLSGPVIAGFTAGAACLIVASQISDLFGIPVPKTTGFFNRLRVAGENAGRANPTSAAIGALCLVVLLYAKDVRVRGRALPKLTPIPLIVLALLTGISYAADLGGSAGVKLVGTIPSSLPTPFFPFGGPNGAADFLALLPSAVLLSVVSYVQTLSVGTVFAKKKGEKLSAPREMLACAVTNLVGGVFQSIQTSGSFTRTAVQYGAGAETPAAGIMVGGLMIVAVLTLTRVLQFLPVCVLAAVVVASTRALLDPSEAIALWRGKPSDCAQLVVTFFAVLILDVQNGLFAGIGFSLLLVLYRSFQPRLEELGRLPATDTYVAVSRYREAVTTPGVVILRLDGEINFGNVRKVAGALLDRLAAHSAALAAVAATATAAGGGDGARASTPSGFRDPALNPRLPAPAAALGGASGSSGSGAWPSSRTRTVYGLALLAEGTDRLTAMLTGGSGGVAGGSGASRRRAASGDDANNDDDDVEAGRPAGAGVRGRGGVVRQQQPSLALRSRHRKGGAGAAGGDGSSDGVDDGVVGDVDAAPDAHAPSGALSSSAPPLSGATSSAAAVDAVSGSSSTPSVSTSAATAAATSASAAAAAAGAATGVSAAVAPASSSADSGVRFAGAGADALKRGRRMSARQLLAISARRFSLYMGGGGSALPALGGVMHRGEVTVDGAATADALAARADEDADGAPGQHHRLLRALILDCSRVVDIDATGCRELQEVLDAYDRAKVPLILAALPGPVRDTMTAFGLDGGPPTATAPTISMVTSAAAAGALAKRLGTRVATALRNGGGGAANEVGSVSSGGTASGSGGGRGGSPSPPPTVVGDDGGASSAAVAPSFADAPAPPAEVLPLCDGARRAILRSLATRYLSVAAAVAAVEAAYESHAAPSAALVAACAGSPDVSLGCRSCGGKGGGHLYGGVRAAPVAGAAGGAPSSAPAAGSGSR
jgi:sulfate permease, SulP family